MDDPSLLIPGVLARSAQTYPDKTALSTVDGQSFTYRAVAAYAARIAQLLRSRGVRVGDRVAILSENKPQWGIAYFGLMTAGAVAVPILPDFHPREIQNILAHAECSALFVSRKLYPKLEGESWPLLHTRILIEDFALVPGELSGASLPDPNDEFFAGTGDAPPLLQLPAGVHPDDVAAIVYTSGTTGFSKGVMLTHRNILSDVTATLRVVYVTAEDRLLSILPLSHTYEGSLGLVAPIMVGASVYYLDRPPSAGVLLPAMAKVRPTVILSVPLIIEKIYKARIQPKLEGKGILPALARLGFVRRAIAHLISAKLLESFGGALKIFCIGGAPLAADVERFLREAGFPYAVGYGLTETAPLVAGIGPEKTRFRSTGPAIPGVTLKIDDPDPVTGEGEIFVKGPMVMKGYFRDPVRTAEVMTPDGWLRTGDLGYTDSDGYLYIRGRLKNLILGPSGKNIYPEEIESTINEFDFVLESLVFEHQNKLIARAHLNYEKLVHRLSTEANLTETQIRERVKVILEELRREVNTRLASFSRLHKIVEQVEPFEKTPTQKIKRHLYLTHNED